MGRSIITLSFFDIWIKIYLLKSLIVKNNRSDYFALKNKVFNVNKPSFVNYISYWINYHHFN